MPASSAESSEDRLPYRELFDAHPDPMWVYDVDTRAFLMVNEAAVARYGYSREEFSRLTIDDIRPVEDRQALRDVVQRLSDGLETSGSWRHRTKSGKTLEVEISSHGVRFDGRAARLVQVHDVTARRAAERERRLLSEAVGAAANAVIITDGTGVIEWVNPAFTRMTGYGFGEAVGRMPQDLVRSGEHDRAFYQELWATILGGDVWRGEVINRRKDGSRYVADQTITPVLADDGRIGHFISVHDDISQRVEAERDLRERVKELRTLYEAGRILQETDVAFGERLQRVVDIVPGASPYPDLTEARLTLRDTGVATPGFRETPWTLSTEIVVGDTTVGGIEMVLTAERPERDEGPFPREARDLLESLAGAVGEAVVRQQVTRQLAQTVTSLDEGVFILEIDDRGRRIVSANPAAERMFGYSAEEMKGSSTEILYPDARSFRRAGDAGIPILEREGVVRSENPMRRRDGSLFDAEQTSSLLDPARGLDGGVVSVIRDVSEAKRAEAELRASEGRFRQIAERIEHAFWIQDLDTQRVEYVSPAFRSIWGRDPAELYADPELWLDSLHPEDRGRLDEAMGGRSSGDYNEEFRIIRPDGEVRWIHDRAFPVRSEDGRVEKVVGVAEDITERKAAEDRLGILSREISDVIFILDANGAVIFSTPSITKVAGYTQAEFESMDPFGPVHEDDLPELKAALSDILATPGAEGRAQYRYRHKNGQLRHMESVGRNLMDQPEVGGILITFRDVTERVELEATMAEGQRLESIGRLAGGIAHDFNNLLTVIRAHTGLLLLDLDASDPVNADLEVVQAAAERATALTSQLLAFSRDQMLRPRVVILCDVVRKTVALVERVIGEDVTIEMDCPGDRPAVEVDPGQLEQVVLNLAINARDAMPGGGTLGLRTFLEEVDEERARELGDVKPGAYTVLEVSDTGIGMDEVIRSRIFEPFFTTRGGQGGSGLGLAMAYGFVKQSGGTIQVRSVPGEGTTFSLWFPAVDRPPDDAEPAARYGDAGPMRGTVLVVEDDESVRRVVVKILERTGLDVVQAGDAEEGLRILGADPGVDLVLSDLGLPGMSGRELVERVRAAQPSLPVVVMSGYAADSPGHRGSLATDMPFLQKPFTPGALTQVVRRALQQE